MADKMSGSQLHDDIARHCDEIAKMFTDGAKVTVIVRNPQVKGDAGVFVSSDTCEAIAMEIRRRQAQVAKEEGKEPPDILEGCSYEDLRHALGRLPATWYPGLIRAIVTASYNEKVWQPGGCSTFVADVETTIQSFTPPASRCGTCPACLRLAKAQAACLRAVNPPLTPPGNGEAVRVVWNDQLAANPCENPKEGGHASRVTAVD
jgi:hypothetical protein